MDINSKIFGLIDTSCRQLFFLVWFSVILSVLINVECSVRVLLYTAHYPHLLDTHWDQFGIGDGGSSSEFLALAHTHTNTHTLSHSRSFNFQLYRRKKKFYFEKKKKLSVSVLSISVTTYNNQRCLLPLKLPTGDSLKSVVLF